MFSTLSFLENFSEDDSAVLGKPVNVWNHLEYGKKTAVLHKAKGILTFHQFRDVTSATDHPRLVLLLH
jgi:hypothetical protein